MRSLKDEYYCGWFIEFFEENGVIGYARKTGYELISLGGNSKGVVLDEIKREINIVEKEGQPGLKICNHCAQESKPPSYKKCWQCGKKYEGNEEITK